MMEKLPIVIGTYHRHRNLYGMWLETDDRLAFDPKSDSIVHPTHYVAIVAQQLNNSNGTVNQREKK